MAYTVASLFRSCVAIAVVAFGFQQLYSGQFVTRLLPALPGWIPSHTLLAYVTGVGLIAAGLAIMRGKREAAIALAAVAVFSLTFVYAPRLLTSPRNAVLWTNAGKAAAFAGSGLLLAGYGWGRYLLAAFLVLAGIQHFLHTGLVAQLVPAWMPSRVMWAYLTGVALLAGGAGLVVRRSVRIAGLLVGIMIGAWVILVHVPRVLAAPGDANELTAVFEALAFSATAFLVWTGRLK